MKRFVDSDFLNSILESSHEAKSEAIAEAVESPIGVGLFGEGAAVLGTWDSHVVVGNGGRFFRSEWTDGPDGVEFHAVENIDVPSSSAIGISVEAVETSQKAVEAMLSGDDEGAAALAEDLLEMVQEGVPVTRGAFLREVSEWTGRDVRFRNRVNAMGLSEASDIPLEDVSRKLFEAAMTTAAEDDESVLYSEAAEEAMVAEEILEAASAFGVRVAVSEAVAPVVADLRAVVKFHELTSAQG